MTEKSKAFTCETLELKEKLEAKCQEGLKVQQFLERTVAEKDAIDTQLANASKSLQEIAQVNESTLSLIASKDQEICQLKENVVLLESEKESIQSNLMAKDQALLNEQEKRAELRCSFDKTAQELKLTKVM